MQLSEPDEVRHENVECHHPRGNDKWLSGILGLVVHAAANRVCFLTTMKEGCPRLSPPTLRVMHFKLLYIAMWILHCGLCKHNHDSHVILEYYTALIFQFIEFKLVAYQFHFSY